MKRIALLVLALTWAMPAYAQQAVRLCFQTGSSGTSCQPVTGSNPLPVTGGGGGGGGTSSVDESAFTAGTTSLTPIGGAFFNSIPSLSNGQTGVAAMTAARSIHTLDDNSAAVLSAVTSTVPAGANTIGNVNPAPNVSPTDCSGTIGTGDTSQTAISAQTTLHGFTIMNIDASTGSGEPLWVAFTGSSAAASTVGSYALSAPTATTFVTPGSFTTPPGFGTNHAVFIVGHTTGHKYSCTWW